MFKARRNTKYVLKNRDARNRKTKLDVGTKIRRTTIKIKPRYKKTLEELMAHCFRSSVNLEA